MELSLGEQRVRIEFNPSNDSKVGVIKEKSAELINLIQELKKFAHFEKKWVNSGDHLIY